MTRWTSQQLDELAAAIADPELTLAETPRWPQWYRELSEADQDSAMRAMMDSEQPKLNAAMERLYSEAFKDAPFTMLALIEAGEIREGDDVLAIMQNVSREHAHSIGKWLALATNAPVHLQLTTIGAAEDIRYTPKQVRDGMQRASGAE